MVLHRQAHESDSDTLVRKLMTIMLPQEYVNFGMNRGVKDIHSKALPSLQEKIAAHAGIGFGIVMSAWDAYDTIVKVGQITLRQLES